MCYVFYDTISISRLRALKTHSIVNGPNKAAAKLLSAKTASGPSAIYDALIRIILARHKEASARHVRVNRVTSDGISQQRQLACKLHQKRVSQM